ncbi:translocation and assembly module protein TamB [Pararhodobacter oceanensis]|uniref:Translocation and assembly module protein TamB n=2 Tax=Pararhodobacter oceanensis TaxID=2172121 RepID=A0A2T8HR65_9RHOB|nr:translocation and assembly module protein TamB [Pararhodobacter oceanensis]
MRTGAEVARRSRRPEWSLWRFWVPLVLIAALLLGGPALSNEEDEGLLARTLQNLLSDAGREVIIRGFEGALSSRATMRELSIADDDGVWITLSDVVIDWNRAALFEGRVSVNELSAATIDLFRLPSTSSASNLPSATAREPFSLPELPVSVRIGEVGAERVRIDAAVMGQAAEISLQGEALLAGGQGDARFEARRVDGQEGVFAFEGDFDNATRFLDLNLELSEGQGGIAATILGIPEQPALGLSVQGAGPLTTFSADIELATDGVPRVTGEFAAIDAAADDSPIDGAGFALDLSGDLRPLLSRELHPFFGNNSQLRASGQRSDSGEVSLPELSISTESMSLNGAASFAASGLPQLVRLTAAIETPDGEPVLLPGTSGVGYITRATLRIDHDAERSRDWRLRGEIDELALPELLVGSALMDARGRLNATSTEPPDADYSPLPVFEGVFEFAAREITAQDAGVQSAIGSELFGLASIAWPGPEEPIELTGLALEGQSLSLTAYGAIDGLDFDGFVEFSAPDLARFSGLAGRALGGAALVTAQGQVNPLTGALDLEADLTTNNLTLDIDEADSMLAGESRMSLSLRRDTEGTALRAFTLRAGTVEASAQGELRPGAVDLQARLAALDLAQMGAGYGGRLALDVALQTEVVPDSEPQAQPAQSENLGQRLRFDGSAVDLQLADLPAGDIISGIFSGATRLHGDLLLHGDQADITAFTVAGPRVELTGAGRWSETDPDLTVDLQRLDLAALGEAGSGALSGELRLTGADGGARRVVLGLGGEGRLRTGNAQIDGLLTEGMDLSADATIAADGAVRIDSAGLAATGLQVDATGLQSADGATRLAIEGRLDNLGRVVAGMSGAVVLNADVERQVGDDGYEVQADLTGPSALALRTRGRIGDDLALALVLQGQLQGALINPLIEPSNVQGLIRLTGAVEGPPSIEALRLSVALEDGRFLQPNAAIAFEGINGEAQINGLDAQVNLSGLSRQGGRGTIAGAISLRGDQQADLTVSVEDFTVRQPSLFDALVSGSVSVVGPLSNGALVRGDVLVEEAEIRIPNSPLARAGFGLQGLRHIGESAASRQTRTAAGIASGTRNGRAPIPLRLDLTMRAPGRVFVRGRGLDAEMGGTLRLGGTLSDVVPSGSFGLIRGRLDLLGNRFNLTDGSASMIGDFMPIVSLVATTESDGVTTSVMLSGPANEPEISFNSVPELPQDEVLARLVFRRSLTTLSPFQAAQLALSVATLTGRAENSILDRTRQAMGLDDLDFTVDDEGNTAVRAGRYIGEEVYTDLSVDSTGRSEVTINLDLTPNVTLRGRVDTDGRSGVGIFFERDY